MSEFGVLLRTFRQQSRDPNGGRPLTQERLAELLSLEAEVERYSGSTVSNWERGLNQIRRDDRAILVALIAVLHKTGGIHTQEQAIQLLLAGNYRPLDQQELGQINSNWGYPHRNRLGNIPSSAEQEALLPAPSYSHLFGVESLIQEVVEKLKTPHPRFVVLTGIGGIGKTAVADAVARRAIHHNLFAHVIWLSAAADMINVSEGTMFQTVIQAMSQHLLPEDNYEQNIAKQLTRLRFMLHQHPHLIIIDDLENLDENRPLLKQLQSMIGVGKCLLTARQHPPIEIEAAAISIPELSLKDAGLLLNHKAETAGVATFKQATEKDIEALYKVVGGHPLALRLIPRLVRMYPLSEILLGWKSVQPGHISTVYQSVYEGLWQSLLPAEKQLLRIMPLISQAGGTLAYLQTISGLPRDTLWPVLTRLIESCLIEPHGTLYEQRYGVHRLTEQYILNRPYLDQEDIPSVELALAALSYWQQYVNALSDKEWSRFDQEQGNLSRALRFSLTLPVEKVTHALQTAWQELFDYLFRYIEQRGHSTKWLPLLEDIATKFQDTPAIYCYLLNRVGEIYRLNHQVTQSIEIHQTVLNTAQQHEVALEVARSNLNLGTAYMYSQLYEKAVDHGNQALELFGNLQLSGKERAATLNLISMSAFMRGKGELSSDQLREAAMIWRDLNYQPELSRTLRNLALVLQTQQDFDGAAKCFIEAKRALAKTTSDLDMTLIYLAEGTFYFDQKQYRKAETIFKHIDLEFLQQSGHVYYQAFALNNLGNVAFIREHYVKAEKLLRESIQYWHQLAEPLQMANSLGKLGDVLGKQGKVEEARSSYSQAIDLLEKYDSTGIMAPLQLDLAQDLERLEDS